MQHLLPSSRRHLDHAGSLVRTWQRLQPPCRALPMSPQLALALAALAEEVGAPDVACLVLVGFVGLLRSSELFRLRGDDVQLHADFAVVRLLETKVGQREARADMVTIESAVALSALQNVLLSRMFIAQGWGLAAWRRLDDCFFYKVHKNTLGSRFTARSTCL